jgi:hypothetical protein
MMPSQACGGSALGKFSGDAIAKACDAWFERRGITKMGFRQTYSPRAPRFAKQREVEVVEVNEKQAIKKQAKAIIARAQKKEKVQLSEEQLAERAKAYRKQEWLRERAKRGITGPMRVRGANGTWTAEKARESWKASDARRKANMTPEQLEAHKAYRREIERKRQENMTPEQKERKRLQNAASKAKIKAKKLAKESEQTQLA